MGKYKVSDEQIAELALKGLSNNGIAVELGIAVSGTFHNRCNEIRKANGIPVWSGKMGRHPKEDKPVVAKSEPTKRPQPTPLKIEPFTGIEAPKPIWGKPTLFPFNLNEQVYYGYRLCTVERIFTDKIILRRNADLRPKAITIEEYIQNPKILRQIDEKPPLKTICDDKRTVIMDKPVFEPIDYIDPEWGRKLTFREKIKKCVAILFGEVEK
jgi:hypothetical protein